MIEPVDLKAKSDAELLQIWRDQVDYREDVVSRVKQEIAQRNLDPNAVRVETLEEKLESEKAAGRFNRLLIVATFQGLFGIAMILMGLPELSEAAHSSHDRGFLLTLSLVPMAIGGLLMAIAAGVAKRRRWAFTGAMILWIINAALYALTFLFALTRVHGDPAVFAMIIFIVISVLFARGYYRLRRTYK